MRPNCICINRHHLQLDRSDRSMNFVGAVKALRKLHESIKSHANLDRRQNDVLTAIVTYGDQVSCH